MFYGLSTDHLANWFCDQPIPIHSYTYRSACKVYVRMHCIVLSFESLSMWLKCQIVCWHAVCMYVRSVSVSTTTATLHCECISVFAIFPIQLGPSVLTLSSQVKSSHNSIECYQLLLLCDCVIYGTANSMKHAHSQCASLQHNSHQFRIDGAHLSNEMRTFMALVDLFTL